MRNQTGLYTVTFMFINERTDRPDAESFVFKDVPFSTVETFIEQQEYAYANLHSLNILYTPDIKFIKESLSEGESCQNSQKN